MFGKGAPRPSLVGHIFSPQFHQSTDSHALGPDITGMNADGTTVTITGANFGAGPGSVKLAHYVVGAKDQPVAATIASWSDNEVTLSLGAPPQGILRAVLTNAAGKWDTQYHYVSKGANVYEQDLPFDASVANAFVYGDGVGDLETRRLPCSSCYLRVPPSWQQES